MGNSRVRVRAYILSRKPPASHTYRLALLASALAARVRHSGCWSRPLLYRIL